MDAWYKIKLYLKTNLDFFVKSTERIFMNIYKKKKKRILYERERERERERENSFTSKIIPNHIAKASTIVLQKKPPNLLRPSLFNQINTYSPQNRTCTHQKIIIRKG